MLDSKKEMNKTMIRNKFLKYLGTGLLTTVMFSACIDGYESEPVEQFSIDYLFSRSDSAGLQARYFLNEIYLNNLYNGHNRVGGDYLDAATDDAMSISNDEPDVLKLFMGQFTASNRVSSDMYWGEFYNGIRKANILINHIDVVPFNLKYTAANGEVHPLNVSMKAEARFLRAHFYFELVKRYGGVPLLGDRVYDLNDDLELPRNTFAECIDYIVSELDAIKDDLRGLPMSDAFEYAHTPTKEACMAMKSRVLLYAASPLFNESPIEPGNELVGYASYDPTRWSLAAQAAKDFIDEFGSEGKANIGLTADVRDVFLGFYDQSTNPELIFFRQDGKNKNVETNNGPLGFTGNALGNGRTTPSQNLVDAFPMLDGKMPGESNKYVYNANDPYANRDPRLNKTVLHHGSNWLGRVLDLTQGGVNNPSGASSNQTGYYMCKFMGKYDSNGRTDYDDQQVHLWPMFRYAEILLNYAEALNESETSPSQEVYDAIIALRQRAGIEAGDDNLYGLDLNMTQGEMREVIQNERRIELAFEEHRYWDIRRWEIAEEVLNQPLRGVTIFSNSGRITYNEVSVLSPKFERRRYLYPIPYAEVIKNRNMIQNPNW